MENAHSGERKLSTASPLQPRRFNHGVLARAPAGQPDHWSMAQVFSPWSPKKQDSERSQTQTAQTSTVGQAFLVGVILSQLFLLGPSQEQGGRGRRRMRLGPRLLLHPCPGGVPATHAETDEEKPAGVQHPLSHPRPPHRGRSLRNTSHHYGGVVRSGTRLTRCVQVRSEQLRYLHPATWPDRLTGPFPNRRSGQNGLSSSKRTAVSSLDSSEPALTPNLERPTYPVVCRSGFTCTIA